MLRLRVLVAMHSLKTLFPSPTCVFFLTLLLLPLVKWESALASQDCIFQITTVSPWPATTIYIWFESATSQRAWQDHVLHLFFSSLKAADWWPETEAVFSTFALLLLGVLALQDHTQSKRATKTASIHLNTHFFFSPEIKIITIANTIKEGRGWHLRS